MDSSNHLTRHTRPSDSSLCVSECQRWRGVGWGGLRFTYTSMLEKESTVTLPSSRYLELINQVFLNLEEGVSEN